MKKNFAFSLVELMISLITISCIAAAFAPTVTKRLTKTNVTISSGASGEQVVELMCTNMFGDNCINCSKDECTMCKITHFLAADKTCSACQAGYFCDGSSNTMPCHDKFGEGCMTCNSEKCMVANLGYFINESGYSIACSTQYDPNCGSCNATQCNACKTGYKFNENKECIAICNPGSKEYTTAGTYAFDIPQGCSTLTATLVAGGGGGGGGSIVEKTQTFVTMGNGNITANANNVVTVNSSGIFTYAVPAELRGKYFKATACGGGGGGGQNVPNPTRDHDYGTKGGNGGYYQDVLVQMPNVTSTQIQVGGGGGTGGQAGGCAYGGGGGKGGISCGSGASWGKGGLWCNGSASGGYDPISGLNGSGGGRGVSRGANGSYYGGGGGGSYSGYWHTYNDGERVHFCSDGAGGGGGGGGATLFYLWPTNASLVAGGGGGGKGGDVITDIPYGYGGGGGGGGGVTAGSANGGSGANGRIGSNTVFGSAYCTGGEISRNGKPGAMRIKYIGANIGGSGGAAGAIVPKQKISATGRITIVVGAGGRGGAAGSGYNSAGAYTNSTNGTKGGQSMIKNSSGAILLQTAPGLGVGSEGGTTTGTATAAGRITNGKSTTAISVSGFASTGGAKTTSKTGTAGGKTTIDGANYCSAGAGSSGAGGNATSYGGCGGGGGGGGYKGGNGAPGYVKIEWSL